MADYFHIIKISGRKYNSRFGLLLIDARTRKGFSQGRLAKKIDMHQSTYCTYEKGKVVPRLDIFMDICQALNMTPNEILNLENIKGKFFEET